MIERLQVCVQGRPRQWDRQTAAALQLAYGQSEAGQRENREQKLSLRPHYPKNNI